MNNESAKSDNNYSLTNLEGTEDIILSSKELTQINVFVQTIDISKSEFVLKYAQLIQDEISYSCSKLLEITKDIPQNTDEIKMVINDISNLTTEPKTILGERRKTKLEYTKVSKELLNLSNIFNSQQLILIGKARELEELEKHTAKYRRWLFMYINAGFIYLNTIKNQDISENASTANSNIFLIEKHNSRLNSYSIFEKRLTSLKASMSIANLSLIQIRLFAKKLETQINEISKIIKSTIPNWRNQIQLAIGIRNLNNLKEKQNNLIFETVKELTNKSRKISTKNAEKIDLYEVNVSLLNIISEYDKTSEKNNNEIFLMQKEIERQLKS